MSDSYILFDIPAGGEPRDAGFLEQLGHRVMVCNGPQGGGTCPVLTGQTCELAGNAHGVVFELDLDRAEHRAILGAYKKSLKPDLPVRVVVRPGQSGAYADLLKGVHVLDHAPAVGDLDGLSAEVDAADL
jgi:hypothetical protein